MSPIASVSTCLRKYADFTGRASRSEYWWFSLAAGVLLGVIWVATILPRFSDALNEGSGDDFLNFGPGLAIYALVALALLLPSLAVTVRRLHDSGKSGFFYFLALVPFVGGIIVLVLMLLPGTPGPNAYGPDPRS